MAVVAVWLQNGRYHVLLLSAPQQHAADSAELMTSTRTMREHIVVSVAAQHSANGLGLGSLFAHN